MNPMTSGKVTKQAFGHQARLGSLYDIRRDKFEGSNLFKQPPPNSMVTTTDCPFTEYIVDENCSQKDTFKKLNVDASLKLSLMAGLIKADGSAKYLNQTKTDSRTVRVTFIFNIRTKKETLEISFDRLSEYFSSNALENPNTTHCVIGIIWGARIAATFEQVLSNSEAAEELQGQLAVHLKKLSLTGKIDGDARVENSKLESLKINFSGDIHIETVPRTLEDVYEIFQTIPLKLKTINQGKGQQLEFEFYPLKQIAQMLKIENRFHLIQEVKENLIIRIEDIFENMLQEKRKFNDFILEIRTWEKYIPSAWLKDIFQKQQNLAAIELETQQEIATVLLKIRCGESDENEMILLLNKFQSNPCSLQSIEDDLKSNSSIQTKIKCLSQFDEIDIKTSAFPNSLILCTDFESIDDFIQTYYNNHIYLLHISNRWIEKDRSNWHRQLRCWKFLYKTETEKSIFRVIDHDLHQNLDYKPETCVIYYAHHGTIKSKDYHQATLRELSLPQIRYIRIANKFLTLENDDIEELHRQFIKNCSNGEIDEKQLVNEFKKFYPKCDARHFCNLLFPIIDKDRNGRLNFHEYMSVLSLIFPSEIEHKLSLIFLICSENKEQVDQDGLTQYLDAVCQLKSEKKSIANDIIKFHRKQYLTKAEFLNCLKSNYQWTMSFLPPLHSDSNEKSLECLWGSNCNDKTKEHVNHFRHSQTSKFDHKHIDPCRYGPNCRLQFATNNSVHNSKYSHPCRFAEQCRNADKEIYLTHEPLNVKLCKYDKNCRDRTKPNHRCQYQHTDLPYYLIPCRDQPNCRNQSENHRMKYSHGEHIDPLQVNKYEKKKDM